MRNVVLAAAFLAMVLFTGCSSKVAAVDDAGNPIPERLGGKYDTMRSNSALTQDAVRFNSLVR